MKSKFFNCNLWRNHYKSVARKLIRTVKGKILTDFALSLREPKIRFLWKNYVTESSLFFLHVVLC